MGNSGRKMACLPLRQGASDEEESEAGDGSFKCGICLEILPPEKRFRKKKCVHPFCADCMSKHIFYMVHDRNSPEVRCPHAGCSRVLDPLSCRHSVSPETLVRWCDVACEAMVLRSGHRYCYCPFRDCSALVLDECRRRKEDAATKVDCPACRRSFCFRCGVRWHEGRACGEKEVGREEEDELFDRLAEKKRWKSCPRCRACVEITSGCAAVTCRCKDRFCYMCGSKYTLLHSFTCTYAWIQNYRGN